MGPADALLMLAVVGVAAGVVLRDIAAYERPDRPRRQRRALRVRVTRRPAPRATPTEVRPEPPAPAYVDVVLADDGTWLGGIARNTEHDERSAGRRVVSALLLLTLTLLAAGLVGAGIYRGLSSLG